MTALAEAAKNGWTCWNRTRTKLLPQAWAEQKHFRDLKTIIKLFGFFLFMKFSHASVLPDLGLDRNQKINTEIPWERLFLWYFHPDWKCGALMRKHVLEKFPQQRFTSIQASTRRSVNFWLPVGSYMLLYLREKETDLNIISAGSGLISREGGMPLGRCNARTVLLVSWHS